MNISIRELPEYEVAFFRRFGSYFEPAPDHWGKLMSWAVRNSLYPPKQCIIGISLDNPNLVESENCRHDACVTIPEGFEKEKHHDDGIQFRKLAGGLYAVYPFYDKPDRLNHAYQFIYEEWLTNSDYVADYIRENLEFNLNNPSEDPEGKCRVDLFVPIKK
jgi:DNA gyrase inhibitor GyrI